MEYDDLDELNDPRCQVCGKQTVLGDSGLFCSDECEVVANGNPALMDQCLDSFKEYEAKIYERYVPDPKPSDENLARKFRLIPGGKND